MEDSTLADIYKDRVMGTLIPAGRYDPYTSTYSGDSGGPLMRFDQETQRWLQLGITSFGAGNKAENPISHYTRISSHVEWIQDIVDNDFHHWLGEWKLDSLSHDDGDDYSPALEWILGLNPTEADTLDWTYSMRHNIIILHRGWYSC
jgi:hypothetical protein